LSTIREALELREREMLAPQAAKSADSRGRLHPETEDDVRPAFQHDRDRIIHSKAFRRLKHKTQVFLAPAGDHYRTRLTHTLEVSQIARTIAKVLQLHEELTESIALGHDLGHTPFGHAGERVLDSLMPGGFRHYEQSLRIVDVLENDGRGLNLTWEVRDGIRAHSWKIDPPPATQEAMCVRYADRIAYLTHDALDAVRAGLLRMEDLPPAIGERFGGVGSSWIGGMIRAVVDNSLDVGEVRMDAASLGVMNELRDFMFERIYLGPEQRRRHVEAIGVIRRLVDHHLAHPEEIPSSYRDSNADLVTQVADYVAGMTDRFAIATHERLFGTPGMADPVL
jgi:dGTPase